MIDKLEYFIGYTQKILEFQRLRSVELNAAFLLPYLRPDMMLLDCGCGLGSITLGFAPILSAGKVFGIDTEMSLLEEAKAVASQKQITNATFQLGNILKIPFPDNTFDVVFEHALLTYVCEYRDIALREMLRVVKPGGIIASRELDIDTMIVYPETPTLAEARKFRNEMFLSGGVNLRTGRELRHLFLQTGCKDIRHSASTVIVADSKRLIFAADYLSSEFTESIFGQKMLSDHLITSDKISAYQKAWHDMVTTPGAYMHYTWCESIGRK